MTTTSKDFKVKHGLQVSEGGSFGAPVSVATPIDANHSTTKEYVDNAVASVVTAVVIGTIDGGSASTTNWDATIDSGYANSF